jgi:hypothetical protein
MATKNGTDIENIQAFPVLTSQLSPSSGRSNSGSNGSGSLSQITEQAFRDILAIRPSHSDPKSILSALQNAFSVTHIDGHTEWSWTPRSFTVQADMGEVTGAQASIYTRAKAALDQSIILLDTLKSLRDDSDNEDSSAVRSIIRSNLIDLVNELGRVGGPRVQLVDSKFETLLGLVGQEAADLNAPIDPEHVHGLLGRLRELYGLSRALVNTIAEEQNLTNYYILVDHISALEQNWRSRRHFFTGEGNNVFLGTQLVQLGWALAVLADTVHESEAILDSVFIGAAERQTMRLAFNQDQVVGSRGRVALVSEPVPNSITMDELLSWIHHFASQEGPLTIREAGKDGVISLLGTVSRLESLLNNLNELIKERSDNRVVLSDGMYTPRVQHTFKDLLIHTQRVKQLIAQLRRLPDPEISFVESQTGELSLKLHIFGTHFQAGLQIKLLSPRINSVVLPLNYQVVSENLIYAIFAYGDLPFTIVITNPDQGSASFNVGGDPGKDSKGGTSSEADRDDPGKDSKGSPSSKAEVDDACHDGGGLS